MKINNLYFILILLLIFDYSFGQTSNYCNLSNYCTNCTICGSDNGDYCSCNFYNSYCINEGSSSSSFLNDFITKYDGCLTNNGNMESVCGTSDISIKDGENKTITFKTTDSSNFICYYNVKKSQINNNKMTITLEKDGLESPKFDLYLIRYNSKNETKITSLSDIVLKNYIQIEDSDCQRISVYFDIEDAQNLEKISLNFLDNNEKVTETPTTTTPNRGISRPSKSSSSSKIGLIIGLVVGSIVLVIGVILAIVLVNKFRSKKEETVIVQTTNTNLNNTTMNNYSDYYRIVNANKEKVDSLFKTELSPKIYNKNNTVNDCYNCTICMEDFIDNKSIVATTKCGHIFHQKCLQNWVYKNIICPKCPNCNYLILGPESNINLENITIPTTFNDTTTNDYNTITNLGVTQ
jgi:hypothetical protein